MRQLLFLVQIIHVLLVVSTLHTHTHTASVNTRDEGECDDDEVCHLSLQCESLQNLLLRCDFIVIFTEASVNEFVVLVFHSELLQESVLPLSIKQTSNITI